MHVRKETITTLVLDRHEVATLRRSVEMYIKYLYQGEAAPPTSTSGRLLAALGDDKEVCFRKLKQD